MVKIVSLFLIGMVVLAMFGRLRWPGALTRLNKLRQNRPLPKPRTCKTCGKMNLRGGACPDCNENNDAE